VRSIRQGLLLWLMGALSLGAVLIALATFLFSLEEMNEVFDEQLRQVAFTVLAHSQGGIATVRSLRSGAMPAQNEDLAGFDFVTQVWTLSGTLVFASRPELQLPISRSEGFQTVRLPSGTWRVYTDRSADYFTQAAQALDVRKRLAADVALKILIPSLAAVPLLALLLLYALRRGLAPLHRAARDVERRSASMLSPIDAEPLPAELKPLVASINALMGRLAQALSAQRRFTADAAHELRTPLTALALQLQALAMADDAAGRDEALADMRQGLARATRLVQQLLQLSRLEPSEEPMRRDAVDLVVLAKRVVADFSARADALGIDLGAAIDGRPPPLIGDAEQLRVLLNNLVDNALRYTPAGGKVDVRVRAGARAGEVCLEVADSGPGVAEAERERIFRRFYRGQAERRGELDPASAGLGLAIVDAVAARHAARIELSSGLGDASGSEGLCVRVGFRAASGFGG
jgi:two-component system OmpR family sensor kinase